MTFLKDIRNLKALLIIIAIIIAVSSLYISNLLVKDLSVEEKHKMEVWAEAMRTMNTADENTDLNLVLKVINANNTIPVIVVDNSGNILLHRNIEIESKDTLSCLHDEYKELQQTGRNIRIAYDSSTPADYIDIYYDESLILKRLSTYPYIQLGVVLIFVSIALFALLSFKKAEQNRVWVGLSKETAHQLGTPISSLMAWIELLKDAYPEDKMIPGLAEDISRLQTIANRFSKIGSAPELETIDLKELLSEIVNYLSHRISDKVQFVKKFPQSPVRVRVNAPLFSWVIENISKNAIDAMNGAGKIEITVTESEHCVWIDISDTGKGIRKGKFNSVFSPGYTTKKRGWGLGLSLARRIVEEYHSGRIFVKESGINVGTTFRIELKK